MSETPMRAAFDAWWAREYGDGQPPLRCPWPDQRDRYLTPAAHTAWRAWQAGVVWFNK